MTGGSLVSQGAITVGDLSSLLLYTAYVGSGLQMLTYVCLPRRFWWLWLIKQIHQKDPSSYAFLRALYFCPKFMNGI